MREFVKLIIEGITAAKIGMNEKKV